MSVSRFASPVAIVLVSMVTGHNARAQTTPVSPVTGIPSTSAPAGQTANPPDQAPNPPANLDAPPARQREPVPSVAAPPEERDRILLENADMASGGQNGQPLVLSGNVLLRYNGYRALCDRATYDRQQRLLTFEGKVSLESAQQTIYADYIQVNTRTNEFLAREGRTVVPPALLGPDIVEPLFLRGQVLKRQGDILTAFNGELTTCDFPNPHYKFGFRQADLIPNDRVVLRDTTLYRYERKIARIRYLVVPIRERSTPSIPPNIGRTEEEGYFIKFVLGYAINAALPGLLRVDLMQKKGVGLGFDQAYRIGDTASGTVLLYSLNDQNRGVYNLNRRINHQQYIGDTLATIASDFQNNSYQSLSANSTTGQTTVTVNRNASSRDTNVSVTQSTSDYSTNSSNSTSYTIAQTERFGATNSVTLRLNGSDSTSRTSGFNSFTSGRTEQNGDIQANARLGVFDTVLKANKSLRLKEKGSSTGNAAFSGTQSLPDLNLTTDSQRFGGSGGFSRFLRRIPAAYTVGYGRFLENVIDTTTETSRNRAVTTGRFLFGFTPRDKQIPITPQGRLALQLGGNFQQTVYRQDAAQYVLSGRSNLVQKLGAQSTVNLSYNYLRPYGGAPQEFRLDQTGSSNNLYSNLTVETYRVRASVITGYDIQAARADQPAGFKKTPWQNLAVQLGFRASPVLQTRFTTAYDINRGTLLDFTNNTRIRGRNSFALDTGLRFDPRRYRFTQITEVMTVPVFSRDLTLSALSSYNGVNYRFEYKQFYLTQSFHDYDLLFSYIDQPYGFRRERGFNFSIRLRAFPSLRPSTTGQFGTPLDTGTGNTF